MTTARHDPGHPASGAADDVRVIAAEPIAATELLDRLRQTRLMGFDGAQVYAGATLSLVEVDPATLVPAQRYVLRSGVERALWLCDELAAFGVDPFALDGGAWFQTSAEPQERVPLLPPIVELTTEPDGRVVPLINDGIHRIYAARSVGSTIRVVLVDGVPAQWPYYALALPQGWDDVVELGELPPGFQKKTYRVPDNYKALFRDFNGVFDGVQRERAQTNPAHLRR
jgi:hypothetical protein